MAKGKMNFEKKDATKDKKLGIKENSPKDMKIDAKGMKPKAKGGKKK